MDLKQICELVNNINMENIQVEFPTGVKLTMSRNAIPSDTNQSFSIQKNIISDQIVVANIESEKVEQLKSNNQIESAQSGNKVLSPIVGTCYMASSPTTRPFVEVGTRVKKGDVLCIVEAMKLMNEIESEYEGIVTEIFVKNEHLVEYGQPMFVIV